MLSNTFRPSTRLGLISCFTDVGLVVHYLSQFLPDLATHMRSLDELMTKDVDHKFLLWTEQHQHTFDDCQTVKQLTSSLQCISKMLFDLDLA